MPVVSFIYMYMHTSQENSPEAAHFQHYHLCCVFQLPFPSKLCAWLVLCLPVEVREHVQNPSACTRGVPGRARSSQLSSPTKMQ